MSNDKNKYYKYLQSEEWKKKRQEAFAFHGRKCRSCGKSKRLEINHRHYRNIYVEEMQDLEVLCHWCHCIYHGASPRKMAKKAGRYLADTHRKTSKKMLRLGPADAITMEEYRTQAQNHRSTMLN